MLSGTEILIAPLFITALLLMSIIDVAFTSLNKISVRRLAASRTSPLTTPLIAAVRSCAGRDWKMGSGNRSFIGTCSVGG